MGFDMSTNGGTGERETGAAAEAPRPARLDAIDFLRGLVMILMALDHVRDFFSDRLFLDATDLTTTTPANPMGNCGWTRIRSWPGYTK